MGIASWKAQRALRGADFGTLLYILEKLPRKVAAPITRSAVRGGAAVMSNTIKLFVPVEYGLLKGTQGYKVRTLKTASMGWVGSVVEKMKEKHFARERPTNIDYLANYGHIAGISTHPLAPPPGTYVPGAFYMNVASGVGMPYTKSKMTDLMRKGLIRAMVQGKA